MRFGITLLVAAGCYSPVPGAGAPCTSDRECPDPLLCVANLCGGEPPDGALDDGRPVDVIDSLTTDAPLGMWSPPVPVGGVNTGSEESDPSFTQDRLTIVFTSDRAGDDDIYIGTRLVASGPFTVIPLVVVNSPDEEHSPEISSDGKTLYFTTNRLGNFDVFKAVQSAGIWQPPVRVDELSSDSTDGDVAISPDGLVAIVARSGRFYRSTRMNQTALWETPVRLAGMFGNSYAAPAFNGNLDLYHHANGADRDLFVARRNATGYDATVSITELATDARDAAPFVSADDRYLVFECARTICESSR